MSKKVKLISFVLIIIILIVSINFAINNGKSNKKLSKKEKLKELINIDELDQEFIDKYFDDYHEMAARDNLENVLIVISEDGIKNTYGAVQVVNAPNHQYFLEYENDNDREEALKKLKKDNYLSVEENTFYEELGEPSSNGDEQAKYNSWGIEAMGLNYAIEESNNRDLPEVVVAQIEGGIDTNLFNQKFPGKMIGTYYTETNSEDPVDAYTDWYHGTHVAGTIAEGTPSNVKILSVKAGEGTYSLTSRITAFNYIINKGNVDVINMSIGGYEYEQAFYQVIESAKNNHIISVAGAGNESDAIKLYPAAYDNTICVSSIDQEKNKAETSNYGTQVTFSGPGVDIKSINGIYSGTSMATPHVSAAVAVAKGFNKNISFEDTIEVLKSTTDDLGDYGWDRKFGYGLINFNNREFCDGSKCDEYNVFKNNELVIDDVVKIEASTFIPNYNYGNITNLMNASIDIYYTDEDFVTKKLDELDDVEITGYDAYSNTIQEVNIVYKNKSCTLEVDNRNDKIFGWEYELIGNSNIKITGFLGSENESKKIYIPNKIDNKNVVSIGDNLFKDNKFIKYISISDSINSIGNSTFKNTNIEIVDIKADSISIGDYAFYNSERLKSVNSKINEIGEYAFYNCFSLNNIVLSDDLKVIKPYVFSNDVNLDSINIPDGLIEIGEYAFSGTKIKNVVIPNGVTVIKNGVFHDCNDLELLTIPEGVKIIGDNSFSFTSLSTIFIPSSVESISSTSFSDINTLMHITVDNNNYYYKSIDNTLIEIATEKLVSGTYKEISNKNVATIPDEVKIIGARAFSNKTQIQIINIPEGVTAVEEYAFTRNKKLEKLVIPLSVISFPVNAIKGSANLSLLKIWLYSNFKTNLVDLSNFINEYDADYRIIDPYDTQVNLNKTNYNAFDKIDTTNLTITNLYKEKNYGNPEYSRSETITSGYTIKYNNGDSLKHGDEYFTVNVITDTGYELEKKVPITVEQLTPEYTVPTDISGDIGSKLSDIILPSGFEWINGNEILNELGVKTYKAKYVPEDNVNYKTIEDIDISVAVTNSRTEITPNITINDKTFDGTNNISLSNIVITNLQSSDYTIVSISNSGIDVGNYDVNVTIRLTDQKYKNYSFENGLQEKEFTTNLKIVPKKIVKPTLIDIKYTFNGSEQEVLLNNFDSDKMNITGNKRVNAGAQNVVISLKSSNYLWSDNTSGDIVLEFRIEKANIIVNDNTTDATYNYDGDLHTININVSSNPSVSIKFMDENNNYTLDIPPKYSDLGSYRIKYKVFIDDNYNEYYGEKVLNIITNNIVNNSSDYTGIYDGLNHSININVEPSNYTIKYSINNTNYDLIELPTFKDVGEYTVNYKITLNGYNDLIGSNKVKIYGIKEIDSSVIKKDNAFVVDNNSFNSLSNKITTYSTSSIYTHYDSNSNVLADDSIKTSDIIRVNINNEKNYDYSIALLGDASGDGKINYLDYVNVYNHIQKVKHPESNKRLLTGVYLLAADMSQDNKINYLDYVRIYNKIKELKGGTN